MLFTERELGDLISGIVGSAVLRLKREPDAEFTTWLVLEHDFNGQEKGLEGRLTAEIIAARNTQNCERLSPLYPPQFIFCDSRSHASKKTAEHIKSHFSNHPKIEDYVCLNSEIQKIERGERQGLSAIFVVTKEVYYDRWQALRCADDFDLTRVDSLPLIANKIDTTKILETTPNLLDLVLPEAGLLPENSDIQEIGVN